MRMSPSPRSFGVALAAGAAAVLLSLGPPASANDGAPHASDQGQSSSSANSQSAEHAQNDQARNDHAAAQAAAGAQQDGGHTAGGTGDTGGAGAAGNGDTQGASGSNPDGGGIDKPWCGTEGNLECQGTSDFDGNNGCGNDADRDDDNNGNCGGGQVKARDCPPASTKSAGRGVERADDRSRIRRCAAAAESSGTSDNTGTSGDTGASGDTPAVAGTTAGAAGTTARPTIDTANILASVAAGTTTAGGSGAGDTTQVLGVSFERQAGPDPGPSPAASPAQVKGIQFERGQLGRTGLDTALLVLIALGLVGTGASLKRLAHRP